MEASQILNEFHALTLVPEFTWVRHLAPVFVLPGFRGEGPAFLLCKNWGKQLGKCQAGTEQAASAIEKSGSGSVETKPRFGWQFWVIAALIVLTIGLIVWKGWQKYCEWRDKKKASQEAEQRKKQAEETQKRMEQARQQRIEQVRLQQEQERARLQQEQEQEQARLEQEQEQEQEQEHAEENAMEDAEKKRRTSAEEESEHEPVTRQSSSLSEGSSRGKKRRKRVKLHRSSSCTSGSSDEDIPSPVERAAAKRRAIEEDSDHDAPNLIQANIVQSGRVASPKQSEDKREKQDRDQEQKEEEGRHAREAENDGEADPGPVVDNGSENTEQRSFTVLSEVDLL